MSRARWSYTAGNYGQTVTVYESPSGVIYGCIARVKKSLKHRNRDVAKEWAKDEAKKLLKGLTPTLVDETPTVARVFAAYITSRGNLERSRSTIDEDKRCVEMFTHVFGGDRDLSKLTLAEWQSFIRRRSTGSIDARGRDVPEKDTEGKPLRKKVRARTVEADCEWIQKVCSWALEWEDMANRSLMRSHPFKRESFRKAIPHEANPRRPVATQDRFEALLAVADRVLMDVRVDGKRKPVRSYFRELLELVNGTARRISAVCQLRYEDLRLPRSKTWPHGAIQWPGETDKMGKAFAAPLTATTRATVDRILSQRPGIGGAYLFPLPSNPSTPVHKDLVSDWLRKAEQLAGVSHLDGATWHAYRRKWATERKHLPVQDVMAAGGWDDPTCLQTIYQQPDPETMYRVVNDPTELREVQ